MSRKQNRDGDDTSPPKKGPSNRMAVDDEDEDVDNSTNSSEFSTESDGDSELRELEEGEQQEGEENTIVDPSKRNAGLPCVYNPRRAADREAGEGEMIYDPSAYAMYHPMTLEWPALSFDFLPTESTATTYPFDVTLAIGSQTARDQDNCVQILRLSNMHKTRKRDEDEAEMDLEDKKHWEGDNLSDTEDDDEDSDVDDEIGLREPRVEVLVSFPMPVGSVNRVRVSSLVPLVAAWTGNEIRVHNAQAGSDPSIVHRYRSGSSDGWALDWSKSNQNQSMLVCGNGEGNIAVCQDVVDGSAGTVTGKVSYSVEDIQTSPTQPNVFITGGTGGIVEVFDIRDRLKKKLDWDGSKGKHCDVNVVCWHPLALMSHFVITGCDDGAVRVWDLRQISAKKSDTILTEISTYHTGGITSIQWSPHNECVSAVASDNEVGIYDFSLERDPAEELEMLALTEDTAPDWLRSMHEGLPEQLLFEHSGLKYAKEVRFHPKIPGFLAVSHEDGLHVFRPCNWKSLMQ
eukprot:PhF_6_TR5190/c0_g1_i1/m.7467/K14848/RRB1, GRWD1; ribosome assembly protein RRB1